MKINYFLEVEAQKNKLDVHNLNKELDIMKRKNAEL